MRNFPTLNIVLLSAGEVIGTSKLVAIDPSMGVATGYLEPSHAYDKSTHAVSIDGDDVDHPPANITFALADGSKIPARAVAIHDFESAGEIEVHAFFTSAEQYESLFPSANEAEQAYWKSRS